jgi:hypothetical protein
MTMAGFELFAIHVRPYDEENQAGWTFEVFVHGKDLPAGALPLFARLGNQAIEAVRVDLDGNGFAGMLQQQPQDGDRLFVRYAGFEEIETSLVYHLTEPHV